MTTCIVNVSVNFIDSFIALYTLFSFSLSEVAALLLAMADLKVSVVVAGSGQPLLTSVSVTSVGELQNAALAAMDDLMPNVDGDGNFVCRLFKMCDGQLSPVHCTDDVRDGDELHALRTSCAGAFSLGSDFRRSTVIGHWVVGFTWRRCMVKNLLKANMSSIVTNDDHIFPAFVVGLQDSKSPLIASGRYIWRIRDDGTLKRLTESRRLIGEFCIVSGRTVWCIDPQRSIKATVFNEQFEHVRDDTFEVANLADVDHTLITCWTEGEREIRLLCINGKRMVIQDKEGDVLREATLPNKIRSIKSAFVQHLGRCVTIAPSGATFMEVRDTRTLARVGVRLRKGARSHVRFAVVDSDRQWVVATVAFAMRAKPLLVAWNLQTGAKFVQCKLTEWLDPLSSRFGADYICRHLAFQFVPGKGTVAATSINHVAEYPLEADVPWVGDKILKQSLPRFSMRLRSIVRKRKHTNI
jgi:hypothetical protein